jgi:hypothetical protein
MSVVSTFDPVDGELSVIGDSLDNGVDVSRNPAGAILVNGGAVDVLGGTPTVANTTRIQAFGLGGDDTISLNETNGALPAANLFGGEGNDTLTGVRARISSSARATTTRCWARVESTCCSAATATTH